MPHREGIEWLREIMRAIVHEYVECSRAEQHSNDEISDERIDCRFVIWREPASDSSFRNRDADDVPDEVHDAVPPYGYWPDAKYFGRNARVGNRHGGELARLALETFSDSAKTLLTNRLPPHRVFPTETIRIDA